VKLGCSFSEKFNPRAPPIHPPRSNHPPSQIHPSIHPPVRAPRAWTYESPPSLTSFHRRSAPCGATGMRRERGRAFSALRKVEWSAVRVMEMGSAGSFTIRTASSATFNAPKSSRAGSARSVQAQDGGGAHHASQGVLDVDGAAHLEHILLALVRVGEKGGWGGSELGGASAVRGGGGARLGGECGVRGRRRSRERSKMTL